MRKFAYVLLITGLALVLFSSATWAKNDQDRQAALQKTSGSPVITLLNINNVTYWMRNTGNGALAPSGQSGAFFPRLTAAVIYESGLLWGGMVKDGMTPELRVGGSAYRTGLTPGAILSPGVAENPNAADVRIWRIRRDYKTADLVQDAAEYNETNLSSVTAGQVDAIRAQYEKDWFEWPWQKGAPFYDVNGNGRLDLGYSQDLNGNGKIDFPGEIEEPGELGADQMIWYVVNDLSAAQTRYFYGSEPIGIEMQVTLWGYKRTDALGNVAFKKYKVMYKGMSNTPTNAYVDSCFFAAWSDPDLGEAGDDFVGCDTTLALSFVYNANARDLNYDKFELPPPAGGYDFLQGPIVPTGNPDDVAIFNGTLRHGYKNLKMSAFNYFAAGSSITDPPQGVYDGTRQWYNMMNGLIPAGTSAFTDGKGNPTRFPLAGDPVQGTGDLDGVILTPGDRRMQMITGPFKLAYGDTQEVVVAAVFGLGGDRQSSVAVMKFNDISAQSAYDNFFVLPVAPPSPKVHVAELNQKIVLNWGEDHELLNEIETQNFLGYHFEGYVVYQLPSASAQLSEGRRLATIDVDNLVSTIFDLQFDPSSGYIVNKPVKFGTNTGLSRSFVITQDVFTGKPLVNGTEYFFVVTAYNNNGDPEVPVHALESTPVVLKAVPQSPNPGVRYMHVDGEVLEVEHVGPSNGEIIATVVDPTKTIDANYEVYFKVRNDSTFWSLYNATANKAIFQEVYEDPATFGANSPVFNGVVVQEYGSLPGMAGWEAIPAANRWWTWAGGAGDYGLSQFNGAMCDGFEYTDFWGLGSVASEIHPVLLKFAETDAQGNLKNPNDPNSSMAYRYLRAATSAPAKPEFAPFIVNPSPGWVFQDRRVVPFVAIDEVTGKQLDIGFMENNVAAGLVDGKYWPPDYTLAAPAGSNTASAGPREWLWIFETVYTADSKPALMTSLLDGDYPVMYWSLAARRGPSAAPKAGDQFRFLAKLPNTAADVFKFSTKASTYTASVAGTDIEAIKVFPNPYYGFNPRETNPVNRFVTFNHMPQYATVKIFDLAGSLVKVLEKEDPTQFLRWDLTNHNNLPVASGIYIAHIDMPKIAKAKIIKVALVREQEFIEVY